VQVQQAPHLLAQMAAARDFLLALHSVLEERPDFAAAGAATLRVVAAAGMNQQGQRLLQLLVALLTLLLSQARPHLIPLGKVGCGLAAVWAATNSCTVRTQQAPPVQQQQHHQQQHSGSPATQHTTQWAHHPMAPSF
jgi:hypothetical protein